MKKTYHTIRQQGKINERELATFLAKNGQGLLPMVELIEQSRMACDQLIDVTGRAVLQAVLQLSAAQVAGGPQQQGKRRSASVVFYGRQAGQVMLSGRVAGKRVSLGGGQSARGAGGCFTINRLGVPPTLQRCWQRPTS